MTKKPRRPGKHLPKPTHRKTSKPRFPAPVTQAVIPTIGGVPAPPRDVPLDLPTVLIDFGDDETEC